MAADAPQPEPRKEPSRAPRTVLTLALGFTLLATCFAGLVAEKREKSIFENEVNVTRLQIEKRLASYAHLLRGTASLFAVSPETTRDQFSAYIGHLRVEEFYPGIRGVGYARTVAPGEAESVIEAERRAGFSDFHFWPEEKDPLRTAVIYIYTAPPRMPTFSVLGYDMRSDPGRRAAMDEARDTGLPQATGRITLLSGMLPDAKEEEKLPGFLIFAPIYRAGGPADTVEQRRANLQGFVYGGFRTRDLLDAVREDFTFKSLGLQIFDGENATPDHLIYARDAEELSAPSLDRWATVQVAGGHPWQIRFSGHPDLNPLAPRLLVPAIAGIGLVLSLIFYSATSRLSQAHAEAEQSAEDAAHNQRLFERIAATSPDVLYVFDVIEQRIVYVNREIQKALGYGPEEIQSMGSELMSKVLHPEDLAIPAGQPTLETLPDGEVLSREIRLRHANGKFRWFLTRTVVFTRWPDGRIHHVLGLGTDITERRAAEAALRTANEAKDNFLAALSHELRTPLTPVLAIVSDLEKNPNFDADLRSEVAMVRRNVELEARLIDDLLDLTRIARGKLVLQLQPSDLREIAVHCTKSVVELQQKEIRLTFDWRAEDSWVLGDRSRLIQVLWNLLKNAVKFTHHGGHVALRSRDEQAEGRGWLVIECEDDGIGISPEVLPGIFKAFEQGSPEITRQFGGLGLGLAISRAIVELHGGKIEARSEGAGRGAVFTIRLPLMPTGEARESAPRAPEPAVAAHESCHLLLVEDHSDTAEILGKRLRRLGYRVTHAGTQAAALEIAHQAQTGQDGGAFDLVLSDLGLPDGTGFELMQRLSSTYGLRGIALSGFGMEADLQRSAQSGFEDHLVKPVDLEQLHRAIENVRHRPRASPATLQPLQEAIRS